MGYEILVSASASLLSIATLKSKGGWCLRKNNMCKSYSEIIAKNITPDWNRWLYSTESLLLSSSSSEPS